MARHRTGQVVYKRGQWFARCVLHREPKSASGKARTEERAVLVDGKPVTSPAVYARRDAEHFVAEWQGRYDRGEWRPEGAAPLPAAPGAQTVQTWVENWLARQTNRDAPKDQARVKFWLPRVPSFAGMAMKDVTPKAVAAWVEALGRLPNGKGHPTAPRTLRNAIDPVRRAIRYATEQEVIPGNPFLFRSKSTSIRVVDAHPEARPLYRLTRVEVETLLGCQQVNPRWRALWTVLFLTGTRVGEAIGLRWCDIREDEPLRRIVVASQIHHRTRERTPLKNGGYREVPEHPVLLAVLSSWRTEGWPAAYGREPTPEDLLVPYRGQPGRPWGPSKGPGGPMDYRDVYKALGKDLEACGIVQHHRTHDARHSFASLCADAGMAENIASLWTHVPNTSAGARSMYVHAGWDRHCAEMAKLVLAIACPVPR